MSKILTGGAGLIFGLVLIFVFLMIESAIIRLVWNKILIKKFPSSNIQILTIWEALGMMVFFHLIFPTPFMVNTSRMVIQEGGKSF